MPRSSGLHGSIMAIFEEYAHVYDVLYREKDYESECDFLEEAFSRFSFGPVRSVLDLGCGTGGHAFPLSRRGYGVEAVDLSQGMLNLASAKAGAERIKFHAGDLRSLDLGKHFDAVIAMFSVICYMNSNEDLLRALRSARKHLAKGGILLFEAWFGPAVFAELPTDRIRVAHSDHGRIIRLAHPEIDPVRQVVNVHFTILEIRENKVVRESEEIHVVRPLFWQEVAMAGPQAGLEVIRVCPFMKLDEEVTLKTWNVLFIARAK